MGRGPIPLPPGWYSVALPLEPRCSTPHRSAVARARYGAIPDRRTGPPHRSRHYFGKNSVDRFGRSDLEAVAHPPYGLASADLAAAGQAQMRRQKIRDADGNAAIKALAWTVLTMTTCARRASCSITSFIQQNNGHPAD